MLRFIAIALIRPGHALVAEPKVHRDRAYAEPADASRRLDVYAPADGKDHPVLVWIHGGGWRQGDKSGVQHKPQAFVEKGFVFVSVNRNLGLPNDEPTKAVFQFLDGLLKGR